MRSLEIKLPLPPSLNSMYVPSKWGKGFSRSGDYSKWLEEAGPYWRRAFPRGVEMLTGRLRLDLTMIRKNTTECDLGNYEKIIADYLEGKFYQNDNQIDENSMTRRIDQTAKKHFLLAKVSEIPDNRFVNVLI